MNYRTSLRIFPGHRIPLYLTTSATALVLCGLASTHADTWLPGAGGSWATPGNWSSGTVPNAIGATAIFNSPTAARTVTNDSGAAGFTVGGISFDIASTFSNTLSTGTTGSKLILDNGGAGVTITTTGAGTGQTTISVPVVLNDLVTATVNQTTPTANGAGSLNLTASIGGIGGFTKQGDALMTFGTGAKTYTGPTVLCGGRTRISSAAQPSATSSFTINAGAQLTLISAGGMYNFGSGPLNLNGAGATSGQFAAFPGAIRNDTGLVITIGNQIVLQSNTVVHVQATAGTGSSATPTGSMTFSNTVSGPGSLSLTGQNSNIDQGTLFLTGNNSYAGGTFVNGGIIAMSGAAATLGIGDVTVDDVLSSASIARLMIQSGVLNAIADTASLSLGGGGVFGVADDGFVELQSGINETVAALFLDGVAQAPGTYGSTDSGAEHMDNEYFSGTGIITVLAAVPEPGTASLLLVGLGALLGVRSRRRDS